MVSVGTAGHLYLAVGDGTALGDVLALYAGDNPDCYMTKGGFHAPPPQPGDVTRTVTLTLNITGRDANDMWDNYRALETKLRQARQAQGPYGTGPGVTLGVRFDAQNTMVYFDVLDGLLTAPDTLTDLFPVPFIENVSLQLICLPYARGMSITDAVSGTLTNGTAATVYRAQVPGDVPALLKMTLVDVSTNSKVINGWRIGQFAMQHAAATDFTPVLDATAVAPGTATTDSSSYLGASFARITTTTSWQTIASVTKPAAQYTSGLFDVWVRARDASAPLGSPDELSVTKGGITIARRGSNSASGTSIQVTWTATTTAANLLLLRLVWTANTPTVPSPWVLAKTAPGTGINIALYYIANAAARTGIELITLSGTATMVAELYEVTGVATSSPLDVTANNSGSGTTWTTGSSGTLSQAHEFVFASLGAIAGSTIASGWNGMGGSDGISQWLETNATTALNPSATLTASTAWAALICAFKAAAAALPSVPAASYIVQVSALDSNGNESVPTQAFTYTLAVTGAIFATWIAPLVGTAAQYRFYFDDGTGSQYFDTGSSTTSYTLTTTSGASPGAPGLGSSTLSELRARIGLASGTVLFDQPGFLCQIGNATWEMVYVGTLDLPPQVAREGGTPPAWLLQLQGQRQGAPSTLDVDGVWLIPHFWSQLQTSYNDGQGTPFNLATKRQWVIDTRRDGRTSVQLQSTADGSEAGQAITVGHLYLGPGDTSVVFMPCIGGGASDVTDCKFTAQLSITPRYALVSGVPL